MPDIARPAWWPPACENCGGFGFVLKTEIRLDPLGMELRTPHSLQRHEHCPVCIDHPGHACSHEEWLKRRLDQLPLQD